MISDRVKSKLLLLNKLFMTPRIFPFRMSKRQFNKVWTGGTFDHFHEGHRELLKTAFDAGDYVVIGITTNNLVKNKRYSELIQPLEERMTNVRKWLDEQFGSERYEMTILDSVYTNACLDPALEANIICFKTEVHGDDINRMRRERGVPELALVSSPGKKEFVSSTTIREDIIHHHEPHDSESLDQN